MMADEIRPTTTWAERRAIVQEARNTAALLLQKLEKLAEMDGLRVEETTNDGNANGVH